MVRGLGRPHVFDFKVAVACDGRVARRVHGGYARTHALVLLHSTVVEVIRKVVVGDEAVVRVQRVRLVSPTLALDSVHERCATIRVLDARLQGSQAVAHYARAGADGGEPTGARERPRRCCQNSTHDRHAQRSTHHPAVVSFVTHLD